MTDSFGQEVFRLTAMTVMQRLKFRRRLVLIEFLIFIVVVFVPRLSPSAFRGTLLTVFAFSAIAAVLFVIFRAVLDIPFEIVIYEKGVEITYSNKTKSAVFRDIINIDRRPSLDGSGFITTLFTESNEVELWLNYTPRYPKIMRELYTAYETFLLNDEEMNITDREYSLNTLRSLNPSILRRPFASITTLFY